MPTVETSKELNRKRVFRLLLEALKSKHTDSETMDGTGVIRNVVQASGIEQRIYTACIDAKGDARDQRMRHSVVYRQMAREALGHIQSSDDVTTCNVDRLADDAVQIHGGMGLMEDLPIERLWRDARLERIWEGTSEIQRHIISRSLLRPLGA